MSENIMERNDMAVKGYLYKRLENLTADSKNLEAKINSVKYEIAEVENKIAEINSNIDSVYEVFSPRPIGKNFNMEEVKALTLRKQELELIEKDYRDSLKLIDKDIAEVKAIMTTDKEFEEESDEIEIDIIPTTQKDIISGYRILEKQENERKEMAMALSSTSMQVLKNLVHKCEVCAKVVDQDPIRAKLEIEIMSRSLKDIINNMKLLVESIRPISYENISMEEALKKLIEGFSKESSANIELVIEGEKVELEETLRGVFIRIIREAVINSISYAEASNIVVFFQYPENNGYGEKQIHVVIEDNGIGFDLEEVEDIDSGIRFMKESVMLLGGTIDVTSATYKGTRIEIYVPIVTN